MHSVTELLNLRGQNVLDTLFKFKRTATVNDKTTYDNRVTIKLQDIAAIYFGTYDLKCHKNIPDQTQYIYIYIYIYIYKITNIQQSV